MDQLLQIFEESSDVFQRVLSEVASTEQKHKLQHMMDIQQNNTVSDNNEAFQLAEDDESDMEFNYFDPIPDNIYNQNLDLKIANIKMNSVSVRRKDQLFKRQKRQQQQKIVQRRRELEQKFPFNSNDLKYQGEFCIKKKDKNQIFVLKYEDFEKLKPETDLNDTIMDNYLKILQVSIIPEEISSKTFIFSTFFMSKLLGQQLRDDNFPEREAESTVEKAKKRVTEVYSTMKRWTKKIDLFSMEYVVIPINAYKHWNCMIVVSPNALLSQVGQCKIVYLDSMVEKKSIFPEAIKTFLELELVDRKNINLELDSVIQTYQLIVPRQTNTHDCGLYTLCYIESMLKSHNIMDQNLQVITKRQQLKLFPRSLVFTMRECLRQLFKNLLTQENKEEVIKQYTAMREQIIQKQSLEADFDLINERQFKKYYRLNSHLLEDKKKKQHQVQYQCKVKFYLDCEVNHYEKDVNPI